MKQQWQNCSSPSCVAAMKLIVAQFSRAKDHESMKAQSVCAVRKRDTVFTPLPASYEPAAAQPIASSVYRWPVGS